MNCRRCHHIEEAHQKADANTTTMGLGKCTIPGCTCRQYVDSIRMIDDEML